MVQLTAGSYLLFHCFHGHSSSLLQVAVFVPICVTLSVPGFRRRAFLAMRAPVCWAPFYIESDGAAFMEKSGTVRSSTWRRTPEDPSPQLHRSENLKTHFHKSPSTFA